MKIVSRNVNGLRAACKKGFLERLQKENPDILCLQEVKSFEDQMPWEIRFLFPFYHYVWHCWTRPWYAGTAIFYRDTLKVVKSLNQFDEPMFFEDGRTTAIEFEYEGKMLHLINCYFPNGWTRSDGTEMLDYKLDFYHKMEEYVESQKKQGKVVLITGDFNICHTEIDIARPKENQHSIGFLPIERAELDHFQSLWYVDLFRKFHPWEKDHYTRWSYRAGAKQNNIGWRLDYFWIDEQYQDLAKSVAHQTEVDASDHCPILLSIA